MNSRNIEININSSNYNCLSIFTYCTLCYLYFVVGVCLWCIITAFISRNQSHISHLESILLTNSSLVLPFTPFLRSYPHHFLLCFWLPNIPAKNLSNQECFRVLFCQIPRQSQSQDTAWKSRKTKHIHSIAVLLGSDSPALCPGPLAICASFILCRSRWHLTHIVEHLTQIPDSYSDFF